MLLIEIIAAHVFKFVFVLVLLFIVVFFFFPLDCWLKEFYTRV